MEKIKIIIVFICLTFLCSCGGSRKDPFILEKTDSSEEEKTMKIETEDAVYHKISAGEALEMMESGNEFILLDVRTDGEYKENRIEGAVLIPDYEVADRAEAELPDKDALILIYCRSGRRSANVAYELIDMGYTNVYDFGGIIDWTYETVSG